MFSFHRLRVHQIRRHHAPAMEMHDEDLFDLDPEDRIDRLVKHLTTPVPAFLRDEMQKAMNDALDGPWLQANSVPPA